MATEAPAQIPAFVTPIHTQADDPEGGAYGIWAAGADYKVSFHDGATFVPYLGGDYPHNQPLQWVTRSVTLGGEELVTRARPAPRQASDVRYEYDHGGVIEAYDVLLEGLEQTFVVSTRPAAAGDLIVRGEVITDLVGEPVAGVHGALSFVDEQGRAILTYGAAVAVDADGRRAEMRTTFRDGAVILELSGAWLAQAAYPVVVDPLMQNNVTLNTYSQAFGYPAYSDVLRDDVRSTENVWICYTRRVSASDLDMWVMRTNDNLPGALFVQAFADITTSWSNWTCQLAHTDGRVVCAFVRDFGTSRNVRWHAHSVNDTANRTGVGFYVASSNNWRVDIGGTMGFSPSERAMVVFQHEPVSPFANSAASDIAGFYLDFSGATTTTDQGVVADPISIEVSTGSDSERPKINQVASGNSVNNRWAVVHQSYNNSISGDDWDVLVYFYDEVGNQLSSRAIEPSNNQHKLGPVVEGNNGRYLVAYASGDLSLINFKTLAKTGYAMNTIRVDFDGSFVSFPHGAQTYLTSLTRSIESGDVAYDTNSDCHWLVMARDNDFLWVDLFGYRGRSETFDSFYTGTSSSTEYPGGISFNDDDSTYVVIGSALQAGSNPVFGNIWSNPAITATSVAGTTCSSATIAWSAVPLRSVSQRIGYEYSAVLISGLPASGVCFLAISLGTANTSLSGIPGVGTGCNLLIDNQTPNFIGVEDFRLHSPFGTAEWRLPIPERLVPDVLYFQGFHTDTTGSVFLSTRRLSVPIGY